MKDINQLRLERQDIYDTNQIDLSMFNPNQINQNESEMRAESR